MRTHQSMARFSFPVLSQRPWAPALFAAALAIAGAIGGSNARAQETEAPDVLVKRISNEVLTSIQSDKSIQQGDVEKISKLVDDKILPSVDFTRMTMLAVGKSWRQATPDQQKKLTEGFKALLVRTYSGAMNQVRDVKLDFLPLRAAPTDTDVVVQTKAIRPQGGEPIKIDYRLRKTDAGWKIYDVNVVGVWLIENYRTTFSQEISKNGIDGLIASLNAKDASVAGKK